MMFRGAFESTSEILFTSTVSLQQVRGRSSKSIRAGDKDDASAHRLADIASLLLRV